MEVWQEHYKFVVNCDALSGRGSDLIRYEKATVYYIYLLSIGRIRLSIALLQ